MKRLVGLVLVAVVFVCASVTAAGAMSRVDPSGADEALLVSQGGSGGCCLFNLWRDAAGALHGWHLRPSGAYVVCLGVDGNQAWIRVVSRTGAAVDLWFMDSRGDGPDEWTVLGYTQWLGRPHPDQGCLRFTRFPSPPPGAGPFGGDISIQAPHS
jgi:hypothetical protein